MDSNISFQNTSFQPAPNLVSQEASDSAIPTATPSPSLNIMSESDIPKSSKINYLFFAIPIFTLVVVAIASFLIVSSVNQKTALESNAATPKKTAVTLAASPTISPNLAIAKRVLDWIDGQKNEKGTYLLAEYSNPASNTAKNGDNRVGIDVIYARYKYWQKTKDQTALASLKADLVTYHDRQKVQKIQNSFWNCKLMLEMEADKSLDKSARDIAREICDRSTSFASRIDDKGPIDNTYKPTTFLDEPDLTSAFSTKPANFSPLETRQYDQPLAEYAAFSSDFVAKFKSTKAPNQLLTSKSLFNAAYSLYLEEKWQTDNPIYVKDECILGIAALDLFSATNDNKYLIFSKNLHKEDLIDKISLIQKNSASEQINCLLFSNQLYHQTKDASLLTSNQQTLTTLLNNNFDKTDAAFFNLSGTNTVKRTRDNAWASIILEESL